MQWVLDNWIWILLGGGMIAMHMFGHGGHGGHGKSHNEAPQADGKAEADPPATTSAGRNAGGDASVASNAGKRRDL